MIKLAFSQKHLSIEDFTPVEVPDFVVLTGTNGSGKSHLLQAIEQRKVTIEGAESSRIVYFNYETFKLENEGAFSAQQLTAEREEAWNFLNQHIIANVASWKTSFLAGDYSTLATICDTQNKYLWFLSKEDIGNDDLYSRLQNYKKTIKEHFVANGNLKDNQQAQAILVLIKGIPFSIDEITKEDFISLYKPFYFKLDFLPQQLGKIIWDYFVRLHHNQVNEFENEKHGKTYPVLSETEFKEKYGEKPWDLINQILEKFSNLEYKINSPEGGDVFSNYQLKLLHTKKTDVQVGFENLSSGERVLMALVASIYKSLSDNHFPDLLLLDEIDASLHPSMINSLLEVINDIFLKQGIKVILVTHSPTTVAIAPEDSIFVMNRDGLDRIQKKTKQDALAILTEGFVTLEEGVKVFDQVSQASLSIITEGKNTLLIKKGLELYGINNVEVISGVEDRSGSTQLKTLFDFFEKIPHTKKVLFVWDCDATSYSSLTANNNTFPFVFAQSVTNTIAKKGIENLFPEVLFASFSTVITSSTGASRTEFDQNRKRDFETFVIGRNTKDDFKDFEPLFAKIAEIAAAKE
jgi:predicted ATPase